MSQPLVPPPPPAGPNKDNTVLIIILAICGGMLMLCICLLPALVLPAVQQAREAARRVQSKNNLAQIGLAMHNYYDVVDQFPPGGIFTVDDTTGNEEPYQSWQTSILPYMDQAALFNRIDMDRAWTDPVNQEPMSTRIETFINPAESNVEPINGYAISHYAANSQVLRPNGDMDIRQMTDGTSNTILAGEVAGSHKAWGDPTNTRDPANGIGQGFDQFGRQRGLGVNILMGDGAVRWIAEDIDPDVLRALATPDGGEQVGEF